MTELQVLQEISATLNNIAITLGLAFGVGIWIWIKGKK